VAKQGKSPKAMLGPPAAESLIYHVWLLDRVRTRTLRVGPTHHGRCVVRAQRLLKAISNIVEGSEQFKDRENPKIAFPAMTR
jgi:hypothetical protein